MCASNYPQFFRVRQNFPRPRVEDVPGEVGRQLARLKLGEKIKPGESVAITAGSRGIANIAVITRAIVEHMKGLGAEPFVVPAMGSHGGGIAVGQREVIESYGITEEFCGCSIRSSMDTVEVCRTAEGLPVHFDRLAFEADHVFVCGRIKPHTRFSGEIQSGLMKMMTLGLGKHSGAKAYHGAFQQHGFVPVVRGAAAEILAKCRIVAGLGIVENGYDETARIEAILPQEIEPREMELLKLARDWLPRLPFEEVDVLVVDEMGKDISGSGMDTNVVGRKAHLREPTGDDTPKVRRIVVRALSEASHGNAYGIGMAAFCATRLIQQMDREATRLNGLTSGDLEIVAPPPDFDTDREMLDAALRGDGDKIVWIKNTLQLAEAECSAAYLDEAKRRDDLEILTPLRELPLDAAGNLPQLDLPAGH